MVRTFLVAAAAMVVAVTVAGCASGQPSSTHSNASSSESSSSSGGSSLPSSSAPATGPSSASPTRSSTAGPSAKQCDTSKLSGNIGPGEGGAAGHVGVTLILTNRGAEQCVLQGWPGVSFVGHGNGTQLGAPAVFLRNTPHPVVALPPGGMAKAMLIIANAANYPDADCLPQMADGFRVYPPGSTASLFVKDTSFTACTKSSATLLQVGALIAG